MRHVARAGFLVLVVGLSWVALAATAHARQLWLEELHAEVRVDKDGSVHVEERIRVHFQGTYNGLLRYIPYRYELWSGERGTIRLSVDAIEDSSGSALEYWTSKKSGELELKIRVPGAQNATQTVVIRYHMLNVIRAYDGADSAFGAHDELYWNVTGTGWPNRIEHASARVRLPEGVPPESVQTNVHVGPYGVRGDAQGRGTVRVEEDGAIYFEASRLGPFEGITIVVGFEPGHVAHPTTWTKVSWFVEDNYFLLFPLLALLAWYLLWRKFGRDDISDRTIIPEFEAPMGLRPAEVGVIVDDTFDQRDMTASIIGLAVIGVITIEYRGKGMSARLHLHRDKMQAANLRSFETRLVSSLFGDGDEVRMSELKYKFHTRVPEIKKLAARGLVKEGFFHKRPSDVRATWNVLTFVALALLVGFGIGLGWGPQYWLTLVVSAIFMFVIARQMPRRTKKGLDALARIRGLEDYLDTAEESRMRELPLTQLEALIPFAIALGIGDRWLEAFARIYAEQPTWIMTDDRGWSPAMLVRATSEVQSDVGSNLYSGPRAAKSSGGSSGFGGSWSGGSGFSSGGGFSGGGFGGGGGGGW